MSHAVAAYLTAKLDQARAAHLARDIDSVFATISGMHEDGYCLFADYLLLHLIGQEILLDTVDGIPGYNAGPIPTTDADRVPFDDEPPF